MSANHQRREALQSEAQRQREALSAHLQGLRPALRVVSPAVSLGRMVSRHPALSALVGVILLRVLARRRLFRLAGALTLAWRTLSGLRRFLGSR